MDEYGKEVERYVDGKCKYCGASKRDFDREEGLELHAYGLIHTDDPKKWVREMFGDDVHFDVIIGNPPYQLNDGGGSGTSASPLYHNFVTQAKLLRPSVLSMVIPARWYSGGKGLDKFRASMLEGEGLFQIDDFPDATAVFPGVQIKGGISVILVKSGFQGNIKVRNYDAASNLLSERERAKLEPGSDVFIRFNGAIDILEKVRAYSDSLGDGLTSFADLVSTRQPFGISSTATGDADEMEPGHVEVRTPKGPLFMKSERVTKGREILGEWKLFVPFLASGSDSFPHSVLSRPSLAKPGLACNESYLTVGPFGSQQLALNAATFMETRIFRFLVLLRKPSQNATRKVYEFVPEIDLFKSWSDDSLCELFGITAKEFEFICSLVRESE
jgi:site-specific DNA-methyltransferase (adenine-specific)